MRIFDSNLKQSSIFDLSKNIHVHFHSKISCQLALENSRQFALENSRQLALKYSRQLAVENTRQLAAENSPNQVNYLKTI